MIFCKTGINRICVLFIVFLSVVQVYATSYSYKQGSDTSKTNIPGMIKDNPILSMLDSLAKITFKGIPDFSCSRPALNIYHFDSGYIPTYADSVYRERISKIGKGSPFGYVYNSMVKQYIDLYAVRKRDLTERILGLSKIYFPLFEEQLDRFNLPLELRYLAVIESALNPSARSSAGAKGLWQFMYNTGKLYDLKVSSYVDDRSDPYKATIAACRHLKDLYAIYGDWALVLAAYNSGAGNVNRAIRKAGGVMDYWAIMRYLPKETRDYVPAFIAASYVLNYAAEHNLYPVFPGITASDIDTVTVKKLLSFEQLSEMFKIPIENIRYLNPGFTKDIIPANEENSYYLRLPSSYVADFINNEEALYAFKTQRSLDREKMMAQVREMQDRTITHMVKEGETLAAIAKKYHCSAADLKKWNGIRKNSVKPHQELVVFVTASIKDKVEKEKHPNKPDTVIVSVTDEGGKDDNAIRGVCNSEPGPPTLETYLGADADRILCNSDEYKSKAFTGENNTGEKYIYHTIRQGDTLWGIANQYKGVTVDQIKQLNQIKNGNSIKPGQKLKIAKS
ncbi:MAG: LysM peptidoglycan-binding domain-containing protein [Bacteroidetes bacterium]|nr:LysM peptidoglycan-binding domain-containing protein [Bacteroidota bacterium]